MCIEEIIDWSFFLSSRKIDCRKRSFWVGSELVILIQFSTCVHNVGDTILRYRGDFWNLNISYNLLLGSYRQLQTPPKSFFKKRSRSWNAKYHIILPFVIVQNVRDLILNQIHITFGGCVVNCNDLYIAYLQKSSKIHWKDPVAEVLLKF